MNRTRPKQVVVRMSEEEMEKLKTQVEKSGMSQQQFIIKAIMDKPVINTDGIKELLPELKRQGANLNQLTKKLNERGFIDYKQELPQLEKELSDIWQQLNAYLQKPKSEQQ